MKVKNNTIYYVFIVWVLVIFIKICFPVSIGKGEYNGYIIGIVAIYCYLLYPSIKVAIISLLSFIILCITSIDLVHPILDTLLIVMTLSSLNATLKSKPTNRDLIIIFIVCSSFIILDCIGLSIPMLYNIDESGDKRYNGILHSGNISASVFCLCQVAVYEIKKYDNKAHIYLFINIIILFLMVFVTKTRSMLFFMPYWIIYTYKTVDRKIFYVGLVFVIVFVTKSFVELQSNLRLEQDGSLLTRAYLYESMINGIIQNYIIIPHGSDAANSLAKQLTSDDNFAPHNDILLYIYDWGFLFFFILYYLYKNIKRAHKIDPLFMSIILGWSSACLHNILLFPQILIIFLISINVYLNTKPKNIHERILK